MATREIAGRLVGEGCPTYVVAEIGINHNGSVDIAKRLIAMAKAVGCDAVKFQKRTPEKCVPPAQRDTDRYPHDVVHATGDRLDAGHARPAWSRALCRDVTYPSEV